MQRRRGCMQAAGSGGLLSAGAAASGRARTRCEMRVTLLVLPLLLLHFCWAQARGVDSQAAVKTVSHADGPASTKLPQVLDELQQTSQLTEDLPKLIKEKGAERDRLKRTRDRAREEARHRNDAAVRELLADGPLSLRQMWEVLSTGRS